jgi:hypothetical protein
MRNFNFRSHPVLDALYIEFRSTTDYIHSIRRVKDVNNRRVEPYEPSMFIFSFFTFNTLYNIYWKTTLNHGCTKTHRNISRTETERINDHQEDLQAIFPYFTDKATNTELEILTKECGQRYAAAHVIDLLADWEGDITITKGYTMEEVYSDLLKFCKRYDIPFVKQDSFESAYTKRYCDNRNKYCRIFK